MMIQKTVKKGLLSFFWPLVIAIPVGGILEYVDQYIFRDWDFVNYLIWLIALDTVLSWVYHWRGGTWSSSGFGRIFVKLLIYSCLLILGHVCGDYTINSESAPAVMSYIKTVIYSAMIIREGSSIIENIDKLDPGFIPKPIKSLFKKLDEEGIKNENDNI